MLPCLFSILLTFLSSYPLSNVVSGIVKKYVILFYLSFRRIPNPCEKKNLFGKNTFGFGQLLYVVNGAYRLLC